MNIGKKILSAFVEVKEDKKGFSEKEAVSIPETVSPIYLRQTDTEKFRQYFDKLFTEANIAGPDYYEFSKMVEAMNTIADEKARYAAAFAGLQVQGLDKAKLLHTASQYLQILETDAENFHSTIDATLEEKVQSKRREIDDKQRRIQELSQEIGTLQTKIDLLAKELGEKEEKIHNSNSSYQTGLESMKANIVSKMEKIRQYIS